MNIGTISKPHERLAELLAGEMDAVNQLIRTRMHDAFRDVVTPIFDRAG